MAGLQSIPSRTSSSKSPFAAGSQTLGQADAQEDEALLTRSLLTADGTAALDADSPQQSMAPSVPSSHDMAAEAALAANDGATGTCPCLSPYQPCVSLCLCHRNSSISLCEIFRSMQMPLSEVRMKRLCMMAVEPPATELKPCTQIHHQQALAGLWQQIAPAIHMQV